MKCHYCYSEIDQDAQFCPYCGKELKNDLRCSECGEVLDEDSFFCPNCGASVKDPIGDIKQQNETYNTQLVVESPNEFNHPNHETVDVSCQTEEKTIGEVQNDSIEQTSKVELGLSLSSSSHDRISLSQGQEITPVNNNADTVENPQRGIDSEENQEAKTSNVVEEHSDAASIPEKHKQKSKKGLFVGALLLFIVISSIALFYWKFNSNPTESNDNFVIAEAALNNENADIEGGIAYLKNFYKVLEGKGYEFNDPATSELGKYMTKAALNKLLVDNEYDDGGPAQLYDFDYFTDGQVGEHGDYNYEISREITYDSDGWYKIYTQFKDNIPPPTLIRIKVEKLGGEYIISDIEVNNEPTSNQTTTSTSQFYDMSGNVSDYPITMHLEIDGSQVKGYYYYDRQYEKRGMEAKLNLSGTYTNGNLGLNETDANGVPTGHFQGQLQDGIYQGEFVTNKGKRMPFRVK